MRAVMVLRGYLYGYTKEGEQAFVPQKTYVNPGAYPGFADL